MVSMVRIISSLTLLIKKGLDLLKCYVIVVLPFSWSIYPINIVLVFGFTTILINYDTPARHSSIR